MSSNPSPTIKYLQAWNQLKATGKVQIAAPAILHRKVVKGVTKKKDEDKVFKLILAEAGYYGKLKFEAYPNMIEIKLERIELLINQL